MSMEKSRKVLLVAMIIFVGSFFLPAIWLSHATPSTLEGYWCAYVSIAYPWTHDGLKDLGSGQVQYVAILLSGWINPLFLITMVLFLREKTGKLGRTLRTVVLFLLPACWVVFFLEHVYPFVGYFVWTGAMLVALFSNSISARSDKQEQIASAGSAAG
jgi:hypothetical protein